MHTDSNTHVTHKQAQTLEQHKMFFSSKSWSIVENEWQREEVPDHGLEKKKTLESSKVIPKQW